MKKISIVGFGRFGKTLYRLLKNNFDVLVFDTKDSTFSGKYSKIKRAKNLDEIYLRKTIFYCVPISEFENVVSKHSKYYDNDHLLIDVLSVKTHPKKVLQKYLKRNKAQAILTHPMFGPDSSKDGFANLPIVLHNLRASEKNYSFWKKYFKKRGLRVVEITPEEHDKLAANSQGVAHFLGRLLHEFGIEATKIDTMGAKKLQELRDQTCNDTWQLFQDLQKFNPHTKNMRLKIGKAYDKVYKKLLPERTDKEHICFGIQGGKGSFNEEALLNYTSRKGIENFKIKYLFTTEKVLRELHKGNVDYGLFAIQNSVGGVVEESIKAMANYKFNIVEEFAIKIRHFLMRLKSVKDKNIKTIKAHPQVLKQCKSTLEEKYSDLTLGSGKGDLIDTAKLAEALAKGKVDSNTYILGPKSLSTLFDLEIIASNLQDDLTNETTFLLVNR